MDPEDSHRSLDDCQVLHSYFLDIEILGDLLKVSNLEFYFHKLHKDFFNSIKDR